MKKLFETKISFKPDYFKMVNGGVKTTVLLTLVLLFLAFQSVLIYAFFMSINVSYCSQAPSVILDKTEEVYVNRLAYIIELSGKNFIGKDLKKITVNNISTIENELISVLDYKAGDSLETVLSSNRLIFNKSYSFKNLRLAAAALEEYANIALTDKKMDKVFSAVNSILSLAMVPQIGIGSEKAMICDVITYALKRRASAVINLSLKSGIYIENELIEKLITKLIKYELRTDNFEKAFNHEKESCIRLIKRQIYSNQSDFGRFNQFALFALVKTSEFYYGDIIEQYTQIINKAIAVEKLDFIEADKKLHELSNLSDKINKSRIYPLAVLTSEINPLILFSLPAVDKFNREFLLQKARSRAIVIKLMARLIENIYGREKLPASINEYMKEKYIKDNPWLAQDPFTNKPFLYSIKGAGEIQIYSAGYDVKDDGGSFSDGRDIEL